MRKSWFALVLALGVHPAAAQLQAQTRATSASPAGPVEIIAHRGASADAPENTLAAFNLAWRTGVKAIELDVHLTSDGQLIVSHDANTKRTTGVDRVIAQSTLAELHTLDAGKWKGAQWTGEKLPTLAEVLATIPDDGKCYIEIKVGAEAVPAVAEAVKASGKRADQLAIISFQIDAVEAAKQQLPELEAYYLASFKQDSTTKAWTPTMEQLIQQAKAVHADGLDLSYNGPIDRAAVQRIKDAGLGIVVWTVDSPDVARQMIGYGVEGVTTNRAAWLQQELARP
jgi:glycerophosphoryl diester phosphodiesterase